MQVTLCAAVSLGGGGNNAEEKRTPWTAVVAGRGGEGWDNSFTQGEK